MTLLFLIVSTCAELPRNDGIACKFEQKKKSSLFRKELRSEGRLWVRGQKLRFDNGSSAIIVNGDQVTMRSGGKSDTLSLSGAPKIEAFLGTFSGLFVGKRDTLEQAFDVQCSADKWELQPKGEQPVKRMSLTFDGNKLTRVDMVEPSGDEITLTLSQCKFGPDAVPDATFQ